MRLYNCWHEGIKSNYFIFVIFFRIYSTEFNTKSKQVRFSSGGMRVEIRTGHQLLCLRFLVPPLSLCLNVSVLADSMLQDIPRAADSYLADQNSSSFYGIRSFIAMFIEDGHQNISWDTLIQFASSLPNHVQNILNYHSMYTLYFTNGVFLWEFPVKMMYEYILLYSYAYYSYFSSQLWF